MMYAWSPSQGLIRSKKAQQTVETKEQEIMIEQAKRLIENLIKDNVSFTLKDVRESDSKGLFTNLTNDELHRELRDFARKFTYGKKIFNQVEDYMTTLVNVPGMGFELVYHPESQNPQLYDGTGDEIEDEPIRPIDTDESFFSIEYAGNSFDGTDFHRVIEITCDPERISYDDLIEQIKDVTENFAFVEPEELDSLTVNGVELETEGWDVDLLQFYMEDEDELVEDDDIFEDDPIEELEDDFEDDFELEDEDDDIEDYFADDIEVEITRQFVTNVTTESQGRLRIPAAVVNEIGSGSIEIRHEQGNLFSIWR